MFCKHCGKQIDDDANFCDYCGKSLSENPPIVNGNTRKKLNKKAAAIGLTVFAVVSISFVTISDRLRISSNEKKFSAIQESYFEFLPDITIGELLNNTHHELNSSAEMWLYDSANKKVTFWGYNNDTNEIATIDFDADVKNNIPNIRSYKVNSGETDLETYILSLYYSNKGIETEKITDDIAENTTQKSEKDENTLSEMSSNIVDSSKDVTEVEESESYNVHFSIDDIVSSSGISQSYYGLYEISDLSCDNGTAIADTEIIGLEITVENVLGIDVSCTDSGTVTISGTIKSINIVTREDIGIVNAFDTDSKYFSITKTVDN